MATPEQGEQSDTNPLQGEQSKEEEESLNTPTVHPSPQPAAVEQDWDWTTEQDWDWIGELELADLPPTGEPELVELPSTGEQEGLQEPQPSTSGYSRKRVHNGVQPEEPAIKKTGCRK